MRKLITLLSIYAFSVISVNAAELEIDVPNGWTATESGVAKGNSELSVGPVLDLGELSVSEYLTKLSKTPVDGMHIASIGEIKDGEIVAQLTRELVQGDNKARSILFVCKKGPNKHRLLELYTDDVFAVISGGKAAIAFCDK